MAKGAAKFILKAFSPRMIAKAMVTFDKSTAVVVSACWAAALITLILAVFAVHGAVSAKKNATDALAVEPVVPQVTNANLSMRDVQGLVDRLQHQFPDIKFDMGANQSIVIHSNDGSKFHQWLTAVSFVDVMAPRYRWALNDMCVGNCAGQDLMKATVVGHTVVFSLPQKP